MGFEIEYTCEECGSSYDGYYGEPEEICCEQCGNTFCEKCDETNPCIKCGMYVCSFCRIDDMCQDCYDDSVEEETEEAIKEQEKV